jgi:hypothetical protein
MNEIQRGRIERARQVVAEAMTPHRSTEPRETGELINDLSVNVGKLSYWLEDMIALAVELGGPPPPPAAPIRGRMGTGTVNDDDEESLAFADESDGLDDQAPTTPRTEVGPFFGWSTPPALDGYGYTLPEDYLCSGAQ